MHLWSQIVDIDINALLNLIRFTTEKKFPLLLHNHTLHVISSYFYVSL